MNVKKFRAATAREALKLVKAELGEDAIVLANRSVPGGVEIIAMPASEIASSPPPAASVKQSSAPKPKTIRPFEPPRIVTADYAARQEDVAAAGEAARVKAGLEALQKRLGRDAGRSVAEPEPPSAAAVSPTVTQQIETLHEQNALLARELQQVRALIEQQLAGFAWNEAIRKAPGRARVLGEMLDAGFSPALARAICDKIEAHAEADAAREAAKARLGARLAVVGDDDELIAKGGVYAIVGPTGVGKTTTTAKIAARCVVQLGAARVAMITTDGFRIGAQEQLRIYGRILGVPVFAVRDAQDLRLTLQELATKHIVLIDTVGLSQRDKAVAQQIAMLSGGGVVKRLLCLNAASRGDTLDDVVRAFGGEGLAGAIITKTDEAVSLAAAVDVVVRHRLLVHYVANGQRVPEDLHLPNRAYLLDRAFRVNRGEEAPWRVAADDAALWLAHAASA
ncbi:flagellar biosynthesis protein FlhF [Hydrogenophilus thermoluteolus]|uniref:Flagellar biosynthesis protein FlhF n=1 Tax=Hydrogenophilus thermoluteolus TaxID=297 RepID=A0A2Z6DZY1_HYDTE|nr:flagellar biosynthesis protein FlhF [Hydrogenophilus thermoluteolus]BBD77900.1 flagellar biosynthesis protein FlhF [Hydrogenophilus thermoluteolus]